MPVIGELSMLMTSRVGMRLALRHGNPRGLPRTYLDELYENYDWGTRRAILRLYRNTADLGELLSKFAAALSTRHLPTLVVWGQRDPMFPRISRMFNIDSSTSNNLSSCPTVGIGP
jgi:pimeloyl-ACP methyl ester carboxylesterase